MAKNGKLTTKQQAAIAALLTARDVRAAAKSAKVGERTLHRWLEDSAFQAALKEAEHTALDIAVRRLTGASQLAIDTLLIVMTNKENAAGTRLRAADVILARLLELRQLATLDERVKHLEEIVAAESHK
jgi:hypothetical protein